MASSGRDLSVFYLFRDSALRRDALQQPPGSVHRYVLFGLDQHAQHGVRARHNLEAEPQRWATLAGRALNGAITRVGGHGGDVARVLPWLPAMREADVVCSTVDTVGLPLALLSRAGLVQSPVLYTAIGLPERLDWLAPGRVRRTYLRALAGMGTIVAYSRSEVAALRAAIGPGPRYEFVPFGVDTAYFAPAPTTAGGPDVVSIGADPHRDYPLLLDVAAKRPELGFHVVATESERPALAAAPPNVRVEFDVPFDRVREYLAAARLVALPVRMNTYSGATTLLLQALAMAKPVVVSAIPAITSGYGLDDGATCRFVVPGDAAELERAIVELLDDTVGAAALGTGARAAAERLSWDRYADAMLELLRDTALTGRRAGAR